MKFTSFFIFISLSWSSLIWADSKEIFVGEARDPKTQELRYREEHTLTRADDGALKKLDTLYKSPSGELNGDLISDLSTGSHCPAHQNRDLRAQRESGLKYLDGDKALLTYKKAGKEKEAQLKLPKKRICAQGALFYIADNWQDLMSDTVQHVRFIVPQKLDDFGFRIKKLKGDMANRTRFKVEFDNWFFRLFAPSLEVDFENSTRRLMQYKGASNLLADGDKVFDVIITYEYK